MSVYTNVLPYELDEFLENYSLGQLQQFVGISDGIENCISYCKNFNPEKSKNPFSYFTQIIYYAFLRRIEKEKKQAYIKHKLTQQKTNISELSSVEDMEQDYVVTKYETGFSVEDYEKKLEEKRSKNRKKKANLEKFLE